MAKRKFAPRGTNITQSNQTQTETTQSTETSAPASETQTEETQVTETQETPFDKTSRSEPVAETTNEHSDLPEESEPASESETVKIDEIESDPDVTEVESDSADLDLEPNDSIPAPAEATPEPEPKPIEVAVNEPPEQRTYQEIKSLDPASEAKPEPNYSARVSAILAQIDDYIEVMTPGRVIENRKGVAKQKSLFMSILNILQLESGEDFKVAMGELFKRLRENRQGCFADRFALRFMAQIDLSTERRTEFEYVLTLMIRLATAPKAERLSLLRAMNLTRALPKLRTDDQTNRALSYIRRYCGAGE